MRIRRCVTTWMSLAAVLVLAVGPAGQVDARRKRAEKPCQYGLIVGAGFARNEDERKLGPNETPEGAGIVKDADKIKATLTANWKFNQVQLDRATYLNNAATKQNIDGGLKDALNAADPVPKKCRYYHVLIRLEGHAVSADPSKTDPDDRFKGIPPPNDGKSHEGFQAWRRPNRVTGSVVFDYELATRVKAIRDVLERQKTKADATLLNYQVIVQVDTCFAESVLKLLIGEKGVSTAWSSGKNTTQQFPLFLGSPWLNGFLSAFTADGVTPDPEKHVTVEMAHISGRDGANAYGKHPNAKDVDRDGNPTKPYDAASDYNPKNQTPAIDPGAGD